MDAMKSGKYRERLLGRRRQILATLARLREERSKASGERSLDWLDEAQAASDGHLLDRLSDAYERELWEIENALRRVLAGRYGLCAACGQPIEQRRLDLFPAVEFCSECQGMREEVERV
jgi:DnaK suppressor protein